MMNNHKTWRLSMIAAMVATGLTACGGSDGNPGEPGRPGGEPADVINQLNLEITDIQFTNGLPTVTVLATNENDESVVGLQAGDWKFKQYQLYPQGFANSGDSARWRYNGQFESVVDNKNGTYTFGFTDLLPLDQQMTQRFSVMIGGGDVTLADGQTTVPRQEINIDTNGHGGNPAYTKDIVSTEACAQCHNPNEKIFHGYYEADTCAGCHNPTYKGDNTSERANWQHLIHAVHDSGYGSEAANHLLSGNCETCHQASEELTEWGNWTRVPTKETCSACHNDGYNADKSIILPTHLAEQSQDSCAGCHSVANIERAHVQATRDNNAAADLLSTKLQLVAATDGTVTATVQLLDQQGAQVDANDYVDSLDFVEIIGNINPQATQLDYYSKAKLAVRGTGDDVIANYITDAGTIETQFNQLLANQYANETALVIAGVRFCASEGQFVACGEHDNYISIDSAAATVAVEGVTLKSRHYDSIDSDSCATCHSEKFQIHNSFEESSHHAGFTFNDDMQVGDCAACHNTHGTYAGGANQGAIEMKLHNTHKSQAIVSDCAQCHIGFNTESFANKTPLATNAGLYSTPWAATCGSCHSFDKAMSSGTVGDHMVNAGGATLNQLIEDVNSVETCSTCHAPVLSNHGALKF